MRKIIIAFIIICCLFNEVSAQTADSLFTSARNAAFKENNYARAKSLAAIALSIAPTYADIEIFLGRLFTWEKNYDSARYHFSNVLKTTPNNPDATIAYIDLEYWNNHLSKALSLCNNGLENHPGSEELLLRKAKILNAQNNFKQAKQAVTQLLLINKNNADAIALSSTINENSAINSIAINYDHSSFDKQFNEDWNFASITYGRKTSFGSFNARINYANRFKKNGIQFETDLYPRINKIFYSYVSFGYSADVGVFPKYRAGVSLYANLPKSFEAEVGYRYLYFSDASNIFTASVGKYYKNFLFTARTYITPSTTGTSKSFSLTSRLYLKTADEYISLSLGTGISPDENNQNIQYNVKKQDLSSKQISASFNHRFLRTNILSFGAGLINQEYLAGIKGNQFNISVGLKHRF